MKKKKEFVLKMIKQYNYNREQAENMYKQLLKVSEKNNLSVEEAVRLTNN